MSEGGGRDWIVDDWGTDVEMHLRGLTRDVLAAPCGEVTVHMWPNIAVAYQGLHGVDARVGHAGSDMKSMWRKEAGEKGRGCPRLVSQMMG